MGAAAAPVAAAPPASAAVCNVTPSTNVPQSGAFLYEGVNIRSGPGTNCVSHGLGYSSHSVTYRCWTVGDNVGGHTTWTYLRNNTTGVTGWVSDQFLSSYGSAYHC
ncbi:hypothetical protein Prum_070530 [Phytohabitans rumicis]|uniref:SH3b domain-containing protein n=1 Tax=Phytohabitans rumicis TaxID=1076125 RepID=A0A6V8LF10_9ACTN|nr:hypothetical protein Prum_070530 [Phytohabitans rumicis]